MSIKVLDDKNQWDKFIDESPNGMVFQKWDFLKIIEKYSGHSLYPFGIYKGEALFALFPLFYKKTKGIKLAYSPPQRGLVYVPYMGPILGSEFEEFGQRKKESTLDMIWSDINGEIKKLKPNVSSMILDPSMEDIRPFIWDGYKVEVNYTYFINLEQSVDEIWEGFDRECKKNINNCKQYDLKIKQVSDVDAFYQIMTEDLKHEKTEFWQSQSHDYLKEIIVAFPEHVKMYFLYMENDIISVRVNSEFKDLCFCWLGDAKASRKIAVNEYLNWEMMKLAKAAGFKRYEIWGGDMRRLNAFKSKFNPELAHYYNLRKEDAIGRVAVWADNILTR